MKAIVYSFYSRDLSQKIKTVMKAKARKGQFIGGYAPYGYDRDPKDKHHLVIDPPAAAIVREIFDLALAGKGTGDIARHLNDQGAETPTRYLKKKFPDSKKFGRASAESCWNSTNVRSVLMRKEYTGAVVSQTHDWKGIDAPQTILKKEEDWIIVPGCHEAIVSAEEYEQAQKAIKKFKNFRRGDPGNYLLRSLVHCGVCGRVMTRNNRTKTVQYYCDKSRHNRDTNCPIGERFAEPELQKVVLANFLQVMNQISDYDQRMKKAASMTKGTEANIKQSLLRIEQSVKQNKLAKVTGYERYSDGEISRSEFTTLRDQLAAELEKLGEEKRALEQQLAELQSTVDPELKQLATAADEALNAEQVTNEMLLFFIERIDVYSGMRVEITYRFRDVLEGIISE